MLRESCSTQLQLPLPYLDRLAQSASHRYKEYVIPKRTGGRRTIHHPARALKAIQRWLLREVLYQWPVHPSAHAYEIGRNIRSNAAVHLGARYVLRIDLRDFFPSLDSSDIEEYWTRHPSTVPDWTEPDMQWFLRIVCRNGVLTVGAPTSPRLSNVLCLEVDRAISALCEQHGAAYSRYADDLFFSTAAQGVLPRLEPAVREVVEEAELPSSLTINEPKTRHFSRRKKMSITGLVLTQYDDISIGRKRKRHLRSMIFGYDALPVEERRHLAGWLAFCSSVEPDFIERLVQKYGAEKVDEAMQMPPAPTNPG